MSQTPRLLFVAWQDPETRRILPVARVIAQEGSYEFAYIRAVEEAEQYGFLSLLSFPERHQVYRSRELLPLLHNRLLQPSRPDYEEYLVELGLDAASAEPFSVLSRSGGRRATDKLEVFAPPVETAEGQLRTIVFARGVRYLEGAEAAIAKLSAGARLEVVAEPDNPHNPKALKLRHSGAFVGYLPDYLVSELRCEPSAVSVTVRKLNLPPAPVHHRMLLEITFPSSDPLPFSGPRYQPLAGDASPFAA